ncbi:ATP-binding protein [Moraxella atlantae]|uniref:ATP-binding protein n=1 Tax=Faucicola atlantae TaxID=34059 RepID=UPI00375376C1
MRHKSKNWHWSLLWRTIFLLTLFVIISQVIIYAWVQRSVSGHFEQMDSEILTHAAFNLRKRMVSLEDHIEPFTVSKSQALIDANHLHSSWLDYDLKTLVSDKNGKLLSSDPSNFINDLPADFSLLQLLQDYRDQQFMIKINNRHYRAIIITHQKVLTFIALPIDVHHQYLIQFNRQLSLILIAITLLLVSVAALSVHWGFAPLATIVQKMKGINLQRLDERIVVSDMPLELRPLTESYNSMMVKLESNFESLSRFSDNIAHELRTPIATLSTQTQVMLTKPRESDEYIEQLHHQHDTLKQLSAMINDMLLLAKTQKELSDSQISHVDIESLITKLIDYYEMIAEDREIIFEKSGDFKTVLGDKGLLQRLFANLMSNAIYYAASNSTIMISATVLTSSTSLNAPKNDIQSPEQLWLRITMTNRLDKPLNQIEADKLFERFYRHDKTNTMHSGAGLGLSIVQAIANAHNGKVSITIKDECLFEVAVKLLIAR